MGGFGGGGEKVLARGDFDGVDIWHGEMAEGETIEESSWEQLAAGYGASKRTIYRWAEEGAPVRAPAQMPGWWAIHRRNRCPPGVEAFAARCSGRVAEGPPGVQAGEVAEEVLAPFELSDSLGGGYAGMLRQAEGWAEVCYRQLAEAGRKSEEAEIDKWKQRWEKALEQVRKLKKDGARIRIDEGEAWDIREAREEARLVLRQMDADVKAMWRRLRPRIKVAVDERAEDRIWAAGWEEVKRGWQETRFAAVLEELGAA